MTDASATGTPPATSRIPPAADIGAGPPRFRRIEEFAAFIAEPVSTHYIRPFWFWNTTIDDDLVVLQLDAMYRQGVRCCYIHSRSGMRPKYLTEEWWRLIGVAVDYARTRGMRIGLVDEFNWPSGELRDFALAGSPSRVVEAMPDARMRMLIESDDRDEHDVVVHEARVGAAPLGLPPFHLVGDCTASVGACRVFSYRAVPTDGVDGGMVDLLNPDAVDVFIDGFYGELVRRFPDDVGATLFGTFCDHEGDFGRRLVYSPRLFEEFQAAKDYDLRPLLPLLGRDSDQATVIRRDWFDVVSDLYARHFFGRIVAFAAGHGLEVIGHTWEESLLLEAAYEGHAMRIHRQWSHPCVDSLAEWGRRPRHLREGLSVARVGGRDLVVEAQGVQGAGSYQSPERIRQVTDMLALWGANVLCPHAFNADRDRSDFPEDWFLSQPWWPYFGHYVDYASRLTAFNGVGVPEPAAAVLYPIESVWAHSVPYFDDSWDYSLDPFNWLDGPRPRWNSDADAVERGYDDLIEVLSRERLDYDILDRDSLALARVEGGAIVVGAMRYPQLVVPPLTFIDHALHEELTRLAAQGATIRVIRPLLPPVVEAAEGASRRDWAENFAARGSAAPRGMISVYDDSASAVAAVSAAHPVACRLTHVSASDVFAAVRRADDGWLVWLVADGAAASAGLTLPAGVTSVVELNLETGRAAHLDAAKEDLLQIDLASRSGRLLWLVTETTAAARVGAAGGALARGGTATITDSRILSDGWTIELLGDRRYLIPWVNAGESCEVPPEAPDSALSAFWLGADRAALRDWMVIGPFPNDADTGWNIAYPPEVEFVPNARYVGRDGLSLAWVEYRSPGPVVSFDDALGTVAAEACSGGGGGEGPLSPEWTVYARASVFSAARRRVVVKAIGDSNVRLWCNEVEVLADRDDHSGYIEMTDAFAQQAEVDLESGWNTVLVKVTRGNRPQRRCRMKIWFVDTEGAAVAQLGAHPRGGEGPGQPGLALTTPPRLRIDLPAGTSRVAIPGLGETSRVWIDGKEVSHEHGVARLMPGARSAVMDVAVAAADQIVGPIAATVEPAPCELGNLVETPLRFASGVLRYRCTTSIASLGPGARLELDLGEVGVCASVRVNGLSLPPRAWSPFRWDVTDVVRVGENEIVVDVANTAAGRRAAQPVDDGEDGWITYGPALLQNLDRNGLHGPVQLRWR